MMDFRQRLEQSRSQPVNNDLPAEAEEPLVSPYFTVDRGKTPVCLDLRMPDGKRMAVPYSYILEMRIDMEAGIEIETTQKHIRITGRQLTKLYEYLIHYRVAFVRAHLGMDAEPDEGVFVKEILIEDRN